ncbi:MAG: type IV conjugative transfer system protein TraL [Acidobacteria bacterium]|nr:type IV conjugative transfer system protein TraL [Acidobacteriota bacterium]
MWTPCPKHLDEPVLILGLEPEDYGLVMLVLLLTSLMWSALLSFGLALLAGMACGRLKRGRPPGALIHALHRLEILPLPGVLRMQPPHYAPW